MEPSDYRRLEEIARQQNASVAELIRTAVRERYLGGGAERRAGAESICSMSLPVIPCAEAEADIAEACGDDVGQIVQDAAQRAASPAV